MEISKSAYDKLNATWLALKTTYGLLFVIAGADKFLNLIVYWPQFLNPMLPSMFGVVPTYIIHAVGIVEIIIGLTVLSQFTKLGGWIVAAWFMLIVVNLLGMWSYLDVAVRDTVLAIGAMALACLTDVKRDIEQAR